MKKKLTPKGIDALPPATGKRYEVRDELVPGLHLRVSSTGGKVWYVSARVKRRVKRMKIGNYPIVSLSDARDKARTIQRDIALGVFEVEKHQVPTLAEAIPEFIEIYAKPRTRDWKGTLSVLQKFKPLFAWPLDEIKRPDVVRVLDQIVADGTALRANRALAALKKMLNWCVDRGVIETSPVVGLKPPAKEVARDRVLTTKELVTCWNAATKEGAPFEQFVHMLILTGQRRGEVAEMRWSEIDFDNALWTIPAKRAKNATTHVVPLAPLALSILRGLPRYLNSDFVFTTTGKTPISGFGRLKRRFDEALPDDTEDWRFHDIRRTTATNMAILGVQPHVIEAVLNHKTGIVSGVAAVYNRHAYFNEKREALERWAVRVKEISNEQVDPRRSAGAHTAAPHRLSPNEYNFCQSAS